MNKSELTYQAIINTTNTNVDQLRIIYDSFRDTSGIKIKNPLKEQLLKDALFNIGLPKNTETVNLYTTRINQKKVSVKIITKYRDVRISFESGKEDGMLMFSYSIKFDPDNLKSIRGVDHFQLPLSDQKIIEMPFFLWRNGTATASYLSQKIKGLINYDSSKDYHHGKIFIRATREDVFKGEVFISPQIKGDLVEIRIDQGIVKKNYSKYFTFALIERSSPHFGSIREILPVINSDKQMTVLIPRFVNNATLIKIFTCDNKNNKFTETNLNLKISRNLEPATIGFNELKKNSHLTNSNFEMYVAPMVRITDLAYGFLIRELFGSENIKTFGEMTASTLFFNLDNLDQSLLSINGLASFFRLSVQKNENLIIPQIAVPTPIDGYGSENLRMAEVVYGSQDAIVETYRRQGLICKALGFDKVQINNCCPSPAVRKYGGGISSLDDSYFDNLLKGVEILSKLGLSVSIKILFQDCEGRVDVVKTVKKIKSLVNVGLKKLFIQAQTARFEGYDHSSSNEIARLINIPVYTNGGIVTLLESDLKLLTLEMGVKDCFYSVEKVMEENKYIKGVMIGRSLVGAGIWSYVGYKPSDEEIMSLANRELELLESQYGGLNVVAKIYAQMRMMYHFRGIEDVYLKDWLVKKTNEAVSLKDITNITKKYDGQYANIQPIIKKIFNEKISNFRK
jgi:tRNA-dihydrouridine synthase